MIYTVTFSPALDYAVFLEHFEQNTINRATHEELRCGGKGVNVSTVLHNLGVDSVALGFLAGFTGKTIQSSLDAQGVRNDFCFLPKGMSRINVKLKCGGETEINGQGPDISPADLDALFAKLDRLTGSDTLVLAGSIPATLPSDMYERVLARLAPKRLRTVVDAGGELLLKVLPYHPFLIKPNHEELGEMCGCAPDPHDLSAIRDCARTLQKQGARNVLVSLADHGALLVTEDGQVLRQEAARGTLVNSVGAGDSMVAGFLAGYQQSGSFSVALKMGAAAGGATAFSHELATRAQVDALLDTL